MSSSKLGSMRERHQKRRRVDLTGYQMILPALVVVGLFTIYPFAYAIYLSLVKYVAYKPQEIGTFYGFGNYAEVANQEFFWESVLNTFVFTAISVGVIVLTALGVALVLNQRFRGANTVTSIMLVSWAVPPASAGLIWRHMLQSTGWINRILVDSGIWSEPVYFLSAPKSVQIMLAVIAQTWQQLPFATLLLLATMQLIPRDLLDSAEIDGAGNMSKFRHITLPFMKPALLVVAAFEAFLALTMYDLVFTFAGGAFGLISYYSYAMLFNYNDFGQGAALSVMLALMSVVVILIILKVVPPEKLYRYSFAGD